MDNKKIPTGWKQHKSQKPPTLEELKSFLSEIFKPSLKLQFKEWVHYQWEEDGKQYSMWCNNGICTGDEGYKNIMDELSKLKI